MTFTQMYDTLDTAVTNISNNILLMPLDFKLSLAQNQTGKKLKDLIEIYATLITQENKS